MTAVVSREDLTITYTYEDGSFEVVTFTSLEELEKHIYG